MRENNKGTFKPVETQEEETCLLNRTALAGPCSHVCATPLRCVYLNTKAEPNEMNDTGSKFIAAELNCTHCFLVFNIKQVSTPTT